MTVLPQGGMHPPTQQFHRWDLRSPLPRMGTENCCMFVLLFFGSSQVVVLFPFLLLDLQLFLMSFRFLSFTSPFSSPLISYHWNSVAVSSQKTQRKQRPSHFVLRDTSSTRTQQSGFAHPWRAQKKHRLFLANEILLGVPFCPLKQIHELGT